MEACRRQAKEKTSFVNKKKQKKFIDAGPWALALTTAMAQHSQKLLCRFLSGRIRPEARSPTAV
jgi:hypothetical protein